MNTHRLLLVSVALITALCSRAGLAMEPQKSTLKDDAETSQGWSCLRCLKAVGVFVKDVPIALHKTAVVIESVEHAITVVTTFKKQHPMAYALFLKCIEGNKQVSSDIEQMQEQLINFGILEQDGTVNPLVIKAAHEIEKLDQEELANNQETNQ